MSMRWREIMLTLSGALTLAACHAKDAEVTLPRPVIAVVVHRDSKPVLATLPGEVNARYATPLSFRIAGKLIERKVRLGDTVTAGQAIARLDADDAQRSLASAQAQLMAAQHRLTFAEQQLDRDRAQAQEQLISTAQLEQTQDAYVAAAAQRDQALQQFALLQNQTQYTVLTADHAGVITAEDADTGQNVAAGQAVYHLAWSGEVDILCDVPESLLNALAIGSSASVSLPAATGRRFTAHVRELSPAADPGSRTYRAKLTLDAPGPEVRLGMTATVTFAAAGEAQADDPITLPASALFHDGNAPAVWVVRPGDQALELRRVQVGRYDDRTISVARGLNDGERVVLQGVHTVSAGETVRAIAPLHPEDFAS
ncbi:RND family efflux transporter, MFP subunit [Paraburkholderia tuberum]|uniref:RND family efflux transporter, MFP subunit n=2 Tax=Paraburkholderia tuberum TaxID=157910 RepID=A0A1H1KEP3_9BURK|nr:RND family efflux transporter, MFP subunit [Paraburkholderia tuberum]